MRGYEKRWREGRRRKEEKGKEAKRDSGCRISRPPPIHFFIPGFCIFVIVFFLLFFPLFLLDSSLLLLIFHFFKLSNFNLPYKISFVMDKLYRFCGGKETNTKITKEKKKKEEEEENERKLIVSQLCWPRVN